MWIVGEDGDAANITRASAMFVKNYGSTRKIYYVEAMLPGFNYGEFSGGSDDFYGNQYGVSVTLQKFDNEDDAKKYIADLVEKLNAEK